MIDLNLIPTEQTVLGLIREPEGQQLEFKKAIPSYLQLATLISGFANADGGILLVGVDEATKTIVGCDWVAMQRVFDKATEHLKAVPNLLMHQVSVQGKVVGYLRVPKSPTLIV